jgi:hypothetical protein
LTEDLYEKEQKATDLSNLNAEYKTQIHVLEEKILQQQEQIQDMMKFSSHVKFKSMDLTEILNPCCLEDDELPLPEEECKEQLTEVVMKVEEQCDNRAHPQKPLHEMEFQLAEVSMVFNII